MKSGSFTCKAGRFVCLFLLIFGWSVTGQAETVMLRYEDLPQRVRESNGAVQSSRFSVEASERRTGSFERSFLPQVEVKGGAAYFKTGNHDRAVQPYGGGEVSVNFFHGGRDRLEEDNRTAQVKAEQARAEKSYREELVTVRLLYWDLVYERERLKTLQTMASLNAENRGAANQRVEKGLTTTTEVLAFTLLGSQMEEEMASAKHEISLVQQALAARLGIAPGATIQTIASIPHEHDPSLLAAASEGDADPDVAFLKAQAKTNETTGKQLSRWWTPSVDVYGGTYLYTLQEREYLDMENRLDAGVGIRLHSTVFDGGRAKRDAQSERMQAQAAMRLARHKEKIAGTEIGLTQEELVHLHELIHGAQSYLTQGRRLLRQTLEEYTLGLRSSQDVLSSIDRLLTLHHQDLDRRREYQKTKVKLMSLLGH